MRILTHLKSYYRKKYSARAKIINSIVSVSGKNKEEILELTDKLSFEYGISPEEYLQEKYYELPLDEQFQKAEEVRVRRRDIKSIADRNEWDEERSEKHLDSVCEKLGITPRQYIRGKYYKKSDEDIERLAIEGRSEDSEENYIQKIALNSGMDIETVREKVKEAGNKYGISARRYYLSRYYEETEQKMARNYLKQKRKNAKREEIFEIIESVSGKDKKEAVRQMGLIRAKGPYFFVSTEYYFHTGLYDYDVETQGDEIDKILHLTMWKRELTRRIKAKFIEVDEGKLAYEDFQEDIEDYYELQKSFLSEGWKIQLTNRIKASIPEVETDPEKRDEICLDMAVTNELLGYNPTEYVSFGFAKKSIPERRTYLSEVQRIKALNAVNTQEAFNLMNSKYDAYVKLEPYYRREIKLIEGEEGYEVFLDFCKRHKTFMKKDNFDSLGRGVKRVKIRYHTVVRNLYDRLTNGGKTIILEEMIKPHHDIAYLNPDSVNTIRMMTFLKGGEVHILSTSMKVGRKGSYIDNGGAGGILVHIDTDTGMFDSDGIDEKGFRYEKHPDHGYTFKGYRLPDWEGAIRLAKKAIMEVDGLNFVGWDLTYTSDNKWVIVEGNPLSQFIGAQATVDRGFRRKFESTFEYDQLIERYNQKKEEEKEKEGEYQFERMDPFQCYCIEDKITPAMKRHYVEERCKATLKYFPDLNNPKKLNEKIFWLALNYKNPDIAIAVDKTRAKEYMEAIIGPGYTIPTYGVYDNASDIDFDALPEAFVVKLNDGWGANTVKVVQHKSTLDLEAFKAELTSWLYPWNNYYYNNMCITDAKLEKPALIVEAFMEDSDKPALTDYKFYCCNGEPKFALVVDDRTTKAESRTFVDMDWNVMRTGRTAKMFSEHPSKPENLELMMDLCRKLSAKFPFVRIDCYEIDGQVYMGEMTFTPGMFMRFTTREWDERLGELLDLSEYMDKTNE